MNFTAHQALALQAKLATCSEFRARVDGCLRVFDDSANYSGTPLQPRVLAMAMTAGRLQELLAPQNAEWWGLIKAKLMANSEGALRDLTQLSREIRFVLCLEKLGP